MDEPLDIHREWPKVLRRDEALAMVRMHSQRPEELWQEVVGPLYDLLAARAVYGKRGRCACGAVHPAWTFKHPRGSKPPRDHLMACPHYVGPLEHQRVSAVNGSYSATGVAMAECSCGTYYRFWVDEGETVQAVCPEILLVWRGPRPKERQEG